MNKAILSLAVGAAALATPVAASIATAPKTTAPAARPAVPATRAALTKSIDANFKAVDTNGDGMLSDAEISAAESKGLNNRVAVARQRLDAEFGKLDINHDGQLSKAEFMAAAPKAPAGTPNASPLLSRFDKNKDGKITLDEFRAPMLARFDVVDANHDGTISASERQAVRARAQNRR